jgi:hypothetical protein
MPEMAPPFHLEPLTMAESTQEAWAETMAQKFQALQQQSQQSMAQSAEMHARLMETWSNPNRVNMKT